MVNSVQLIGGGNQLTYPCVLVAFRRRSNPITYEKNFVETFFKLYKLQITSFFKWLNWRKMRLISTQWGSHVCQITCSIFKSGTSLSESLKLSLWSEVNSLYNIENKNSSWITYLAQTYLRTTHMYSRSFFHGSHWIRWSYPWQNWPCSLETRV